jgi:hypothetical protein
MERCESHVIEPRNNDQRWSLRSPDRGGRIEAPQKAWRGDPTGVLEQGKSTKGYPGNLRDPTDFLQERKNRSKGRDRSTNAQAQREGLQEPEASERAGSQGGNPRSQENEERGDEQPEVLASS